VTPSAQLKLWIPEWSVPGVGALCTTREGGVSAPPYDSLNLGLHVGDDPGSVMANRLRVSQALQARPVWLNQVHGTEVLRLHGSPVDGLTADAVCTTDRGLACTIMVADCLPVLFADPLGRVVAAAHAGWRGLAGPDERGGVLDTTVAAVRGILSSEWGVAGPSPLMAWLGPCIGPNAFEVGPEVIQAFDRHGFEAAGLWRPHPEHAGKWLMDLAGLARQRLKALGVEEIGGNNGSPEWCTVSQSTLWFSHRRDRVSGRLAACIWRI
jgi:YfiH family protein